MTVIVRLTPLSTGTGTRYDVTAQDAARWLATFSVQGTAAAYRIHLKYACTIARKSTDWATEGDLVKRVIEGIGKEPDKLVVKPVKWTCRRSKAIPMSKWARDQDDLGLQAVIILAYNFQYRVFSEPFNVHTYLI